MWTINIPVLSTSHAPSMGAIVALCDNNGGAANYRDGFIFIYLPLQEEGSGEAWANPIAEWVLETYDDHWVRFDPDGDIIPELPVYDW